MHSHSADQGDEVNAYVEALEAERMKMMMFKSALPLSIELVSRTIDSCKERLSSGVERQHVCESSSEETTSDDVDVHVLEFIPIKRCSNGSSSESEDIQPSNDDKDDIYDVGKKSDWLSSAQLWNMSPDLPSKSEELENLEGKCKSSDKDLEEKSCNPKKAESSSTESQKSGGECKKDDKEGNSKRKQRRCWSQDLHRRFLHSLKQLGGAHVATPKQIRELMKVDGLTNDEVKSHLQKYRLHTRRPTPPSIQCNAEAPPQFVVEGNIWAPTSRGSNGALGTSGTCVYIPMGAPPPAQPQSWQEQPFNQISQIKSKNPEVLGDGLARCISPSMSSSTRTTASQVY